MRNMSVLEALQETVADLEGGIDLLKGTGTMRLNAEGRQVVIDTMRESIDTINGALELLGAASNVRPSTRRPRASASNAPRTRKKSAYQIWASKERPKIVKQHPRFSFGRVNQELGKRWKREKKKRGKK